MKIILNMESLKINILLLSMMVFIIIINLLIMEKNLIDK